MTIVPASRPVDIPTAGPGPVPRGAPPPAEETLAAYAARLAAKGAADRSASGGRSWGAAAAKPSRPTDARPAGTPPRIVGFVVGTPVRPVPSPDPTSAKPAVVVVAPTSRIPRGRPFVPVLPVLRERSEQSCPVRRGGADDGRSG